MQTVCIAVGVFSEVLHGHNTRLCHPAPGGTTLLSAMDKNHWNISRAQVTALGTWRAVSWSDFPWGLISTPRGNLQILPSSTCEEMLPCFNNFLGPERWRCDLPSVAPLRCCRGAFSRSLDRNRLSLGGKSYSFFPWRLSCMGMYRKYHRLWKITPALRNIGISYIEFLIHVYTVGSV